jgi:hypothetical protein
MLERNVLLRAVLVDAARCFRRQPQQVPDRRTRLRPRTEFQHLTEEDEHDDYRCRLEVDGDLAHYAKRVGKQAGRERRDDAVGIRCSDTERN